MLVRCEWPVGFLFVLIKDVWLKNNENVDFEKMGRKLDENRGERMKWDAREREEHTM